MGSPARRAGAAPSAAGPPPHRPDRRWWPAGDTGHDRVGHDAGRPGRALLRRPAGGGAAGPRVAAVAAGPAGTAGADGGPGPGLRALLCAGPSLAFLVTG